MAEITRLDFADDIAAYSSNMKTAVAEYRNTTLGTAGKSADMPAIMGRISNAA